MAQEIGKTEKGKTKSEKKAELLISHMFNIEYVQKADAFL